MSKLKKIKPSTHSSKTILTSSEEETIAIAESFARSLSSNLSSPNIICLYGDLGSGKTVFVKGIAKAFYIDSYTVKSPTYTFVREYIAQNGKLIHVDLYRLNEADDILFKQIDEFKSQKGNLVVIEWADRLKLSLPEKRIDICFEYIDRDKRKITIFR